MFITPPFSDTATPSPNPQTGSVFLCFFRCAKRWYTTPKIQTVCRRCRWQKCFSSEPFVAPGTFITAGVTFILAEFLKSSSPFVTFLSVTVLFTAACFFWVCVILCFLQKHHPVSLSIVADHNGKHIVVAHRNACISISYPCFTSKYHQHLRLPQNCLPSLQ